MIFNELADELIHEFERTLAEFGVPTERSRAAARVIYHSYLGIVFSWAGTTSNVTAVLDELSATVAVVTRVQRD